MPFYLDLALKNPLSVALKMTDIHIRVTTIEESGNASESVEDFQGVELASVPDLELLPDEYRTVSVFRYIFFSFTGWKIKDGITLLVTCCRSLSRSSALKRTQSLSLVRSSTSLME